MNNQQTSRRGITQEGVYKNCHSKFNLESHHMLLSKVRSHIKYGMTPLFDNNMRGRCQIKFGMTSLCNNGGRRGFTLIELIVVVLIIGILSAVALPQYQKAVKKAQGREALVAIDALDKALTTHYLEHGIYDRQIILDEINIDIPELHHFRYMVGSIGPYETGTSQLTTDNLFYVGGDTAGLILKGPKEIEVKAWWRKGEKLYIHCTGKEGGCTEYFNCLSGGEKVWTGSSWDYKSCTLK